MRATDIKRRLDLIVEARRDDWHGQIMPSSVVVNVTIPPKSEADSGQRKVVISSARVELPWP